MEEVGFSLDVMVRQFDICRQRTEELGEVPTELFLLSYREISKLLDVLGRAFYFVKGDVNEKLGIITQLYATNQKEYHTIQKMISSEVANNRHNTPDRKSGRYAFPNSSTMNASDINVRYIILVVLY
jgi:hypothetical protein